MRPIEVVKTNLKLIVRPIYLLKPEVEIFKIPNTFASFFETKNLKIFISNIIFFFKNEILLSIIINNFFSS